MKGYLNQLRKTVSIKGRPLKKPQRLRWGFPIHFYD